MQMHDLNFGVAPEPQVQMDDSAQEQTDSPRHRACAIGRQKLMFSQQILGQVDL